MEAFVYLLIFSFLLDPMLHGLGDAVFCVLIFCLIYTYRKGQTSQICSWIIYTVLCFWAFPGSDDINSAAVICGHSDVCMLSYSILVFICMSPMLSVTLFTRVHPAFNKMPGVFIRALLTQVTEDILKITILSE